MSGTGEIFFADGAIEARISCGLVWLDDVVLDVIAVVPLCPCKVVDLFHDFVDPFVA